MIVPRTRPVAVAFMTSSMIDKVIADTYRIERVIGTGGMGTVFEAVHLRIPKRFAIKLLTRKLTRSRQALERFYREAKVTSELGHENIVQVIDFNSTDQGEPFIVMELLRGEDLASRIYRLSRVSLDETNHILHQVASAMDVVHKRGIVHRDLKPQNIFLCTREGKDDLVKVLDFGISKILGAESLVTSTRTLLGSLYFISPEQTRSSDVDPQADIYSMGCIVYTMLAGVPPFYSKESVDLVEQIMTTDPPSICELNQTIPPLVEQAVLGALQKHPEDRYGSMLEFADELERALLRSRSEAFERTDLIKTPELLQRLEQAEKEEPPGFSEHVLADLRTELLDGHHSDTVQLTDEELEEDEEPVTPGPGLPGDDSRAGVEQLDEAETPGPEVDRAYLHTMPDPRTNLDWPLGKSHEKSTDEWLAVSRAQAQEDGQTVNGESETDKVLRISAAALQDDQQQDLGALETPPPPPDITGPVKPLAPALAPPPPPDVTGPVQLFDQDTDQVIMLRKDHKKVPARERIPEVVWHDEAGAGRGDTDPEPASEEDSHLFHRVTLLDVSPDERPQSNRGPLYTVVGLAGGLALVVLLTLLVTDGENSSAPPAATPDGAPRAVSAPTPDHPPTTSALSQPRPAAPVARPARPAQPGPKRPAPTRTGLLVITTTAGGESIWAHVYLNGRQVGSTPLRHKLPVGIHHIELRKPGYSTISTRTKISEGKTKRIPFELTPRPSAGAKTSGDPDNKGATK